MGNHFGEKILQKYIPMTAFLAVENNYFSFYINSCRTFHTRKIIKRVLF